LGQILKDIHIPDDVSWHILENSRTEDQRRSATDKKEQQGRLRFPRESLISKVTVKHPVIE
jgi:hypothetical protein